MEDIERLRKQRKFDDIKHAVRKLEVVIEVAMLVCIYYVIWRTQYDSSGFYTYYGYGKYVMMLVYAFLTLLLFQYCDGFRFGHLKLIDIMLAQWIAIVLVNVVAYFQLCLMANHMIRLLPMILLTGIDIVIAFVCVSLFTIIYHGLHIPRNMLMIFGNENSITLKFKMDARTDKYRIKKMVSIEMGFDVICNIIPNYDAIVLSDIPAEIRNDILKFCYMNGIRVYMTPKLSDIVIKGAEDITLFDTPLLLVRGRGLTWSQSFAKRMIDILLCVIAMIPALPVMIVVAAAIKLEDGGPVFYKQKRVTKNGKIFNILKFRSMIVDAEKDGKPVPASGGDSRITRVGRITRATRIDELPQILNILKGDMSIVGPRPERVEHVEEYSKEIPEFEYRTKVKGGLTGYAQVYGKYNTTAYDKLRLDLMYIENYSIILDIKLMLMTLRVMIKPEATEGFEKIDELELLKQEALAEVNSNHRHIIDNRN